MLKTQTTHLTVSLLPGEIQPGISNLIKSKITDQKNKYSKQHKLYIKNITDVSVPEYGITSRTNFVVYFSVLCNVEYIKPEKCDIVHASLQNKNQYGIFLKNEYSRIIVPRSYYQCDSLFEINQEYCLKVLETRYTADGISCICTFVQCDDPRDHTL